MCVCVHAGVVCEELIQYFDYTSTIFEVLIYIYCVYACVTLVGEIQHYRKDCYYYYYDIKNLTSNTACVCTACMILCVCVCVAVMAILTQTT